jgi:hypothetical protein
MCLVNCTYRVDEKVSGLSFHRNGNNEDHLQVQSLWQAPVNELDTIRLSRWLPIHTPFNIKTDEQKKSSD